MSKYHEILKKYWGYDDFRPLQADIIESVGQGRDTLALMPTGGGKSLCFQVPTMAMKGLCLVITPLIALMKDQVENLRARDIKADAIYTGLTRREIQIKLDNCQFGDYKFLYVSPERLESEDFRKRLTELPICLIAVDEAHCISQWGYDFRPAYLRINQIREPRAKNQESGLNSCPILALTATATPEVVEDIQEKLGFRERNVFLKSFKRDNLSYVVRHVEDKLEHMLHILQSVPGSAIVYVRNRQHTKEVAEWINQALKKPTEDEGQRTRDNSGKSSEGTIATYYHAGLNYSTKTSRQESWKRGNTRVMVCTNAFGMGIDKPDVRVVIHLDLPDSLEAYFQEAGRAGRDGKESFAVLLYNEGDNTKVKQRIRDSYPTKNYIKKVYQALGDYYEIGIGSGLGHTFAFPFEQFCVENGLHFLQTFSALQILTQAGYIHYIEETETNPRVKFRCTREELYHVAFTPLQDRIVNHLLRTYTGIFTDPQYIHDTTIAERLSIETKALHEELISLAQQDILQYIPRRKTPYVAFTLEREQLDRLVLPESVYEERQEVYIKRITAMLEYAQQMTICRSQILLGYFGETDAEPCNNCDICRQKKVGTVFVER